MYLDLFKKYFWIITLILLMFAALISADIVNNIIRGAIELPLNSISVAENGKTSRQRNDFPEVRDIGYYSIIYERNIFNSKASPFSGIKPGEGPAPLSELRAKLIGTVVGSEDVSFAVIINSDSQDVGIYKVNDMLMNEARIMKIERSRVILYRNGKQESLVIYEAEYASSGESVSEAALHSDYNIKQITENRFTIAKEEMERSTQNLGKLMTEARLIPNLDGGSIKGYKIFAIKPDSLYTKIGLQNGDVIQRINGIDISDPEKALQLFQQLKNEKYFQVEIVRSNARQTLVYNVQ